MTEIVGDWEVDLLDPLVENMQALAATIVEHDVIEGANGVASEVGEALALLDTWRNLDEFDGDLGNFAIRENVAWWNFWNYLGQHIQGWWD